jgi:hypothetical protein
VIRRRSRQGKSQKEAQRAEEQRTEICWAPRHKVETLVRNAASKAGLSRTGKRATESRGSDFQNPRVTWMRRAHMPAAASGSPSISGSGTLRLRAVETDGGSGRGRIEAVDYGRGRETPMRATGDGLRDHAHHTHHGPALAHLVAAPSRAGVNAAASFAHYIPRNPVLSQGGKLELAAAAV